MGLSSKQVIINRDGLDWCSTQTLLQSSLHDHQISLELLHHRKLPPSSSTTTTMRRQQSNQQQSEPLKCPRCDSTNTKFCYYNNYNKSQPRHFCRACKRHWTKGGTLRNVPIGGGRKNNKRPNKKSASTATTAAASTVTKDAIFQAQQPNIIGGSISIFPNNNNNLTLGDLHQDKKSTTSEILPQSVLIRPQSLNINPDLDSKSLITNKANTGFNFLPNQSLQFQAGVFSSSTSSPFESSLSSISNSFQTSNVVCDYGTDDQFKFMGDQATVTSSSTVQPPWQVPAATSNGMDLSNYWNWEDIDTLVSADHIDLPWDDSHNFKP